MKYNIEYSRESIKMMKSMDKETANRIRKWFNNVLLKCNSPRDKGKALQGNLNKYWRYRIGNYRVIVDIKDKDLIVYIIKIEHRNKVYKEEATDVITLNKRSLNKNGYNEFEF